MEGNDIYPIGQQDFKSLRLDEAAYWELNYKPFPSKIISALGHDRSDVRL